MLPAPMIWIMWMIVPGDSQYRSFHSPFTEYSSVSSIKCATVDMYNQDTEKTKIPLKIFTHDRRIRKRKGVFASSFADMVNKCKEKFTIAEGNHITFVLNEDGVEIDDEFFSTLTPNTILMILNEGETWNKQFESSGREQDTHQHQAWKSITEYDEKRLTENLKDSEEFSEICSIKPDDTFTSSLGYATSVNEQNEVFSDVSLGTISGDCLTLDTDESEYSDTNSSDITDPTSECESERSNDCHFESVLTNEFGALKIYACFHRHYSTAIACKDITDTLKTIFNGAEHSHTLNYEYLMSFVQKYPIKEVPYCESFFEVFPDNLELVRCSTENCTGCGFNRDGQPRKCFIFADTKNLLKDLLHSPELIDIKFKVKCAKNSSEVITHGDILKPYLGSQKMVWCNQQNARSDVPDAHPVEFPDYAKVTADVDDENRSVSENLPRIIGEKEICPPKIVPVSANDGENHSDTCPTNLRIPESGTRPARPSARIRNHMTISASTNTRTRTINKPKRFLDISSLYIMPEVIM
ncbi:Hypothetical predicted protein [Mytilus galloprovincialis]|uniref:CIDE-N domain-containing protein n=1 Tax=Mytilus galloprovincialis TaxID=29158 RepID=A0A8B6FKH3_MYTGA|nr:Hypothetical predicted protein [Mytilus galloprovincialis]